jgi:hypothetical protein
MDELSGLSSAANTVPGMLPKANVSAQTSPVKPKVVFSDEVIFINLSRSTNVATDGWNSAKLLFRHRRRSVTFPLAAQDCR